MQHSRWRRLPSMAVDAWLVARAWVSLARVDHDLRTHGFQDVVQRFGASTLPEGTSISSLQLRHARRYARRIDDAARFHIVSARCLHRSLVLHAWLRKQDLPSELRIGVLKTRGELGAHAWVEMGPFLVNDRRDAIARHAVILSVSANLVPGDVVWLKR